MGYKRLTSKQTIKHADGTEHVETYCHGHRYGPAAFPKKYGTSDPEEYNDYCETVDRLAAFEDSGLSPGEAQEFAKAKAEGRLVVLPCKVGDTVYKVKVGTNRILERKVNGFIKTRFIGEWRVTVEIGNSFSSVDAIGKTVFLTREEAEKALGEV